MFLSLGQLVTHTVAVTNVLTIWLLIGTLGIAVFHDVRDRRIPNRLVGAALVMQLVIAFIGGLPQLVTSFYGSSVCFGTMLFAYCFFDIGAGDVKLAAFIGACVGPLSGIETLIWAHCLAGVAAFTALTTCFVLDAVIRQLADVQNGKTLAPSTSDILNYPVPMAVFFAAGTACHLSLGSLL